MDVLAGVQCHQSSVHTASPRKQNQRPVSFSLMGAVGPWDGVSDGVGGGGMVSAGEEICYLEARQAMITSCQC